MPAKKCSSGKQKCQKIKMARAKKRDALAREKRRMKMRRGGYNRLA